ncbi:hypothetical protein ACJJTC_000408 [Scirpophaga incertulas]
MDNEQLKRLKKKRSSYKGQLTLFENYLLTLEDTTLSKRQVMELQLRITKLESVLKEFDAVQLDIECICDDAQLEISERELVETKYYSLVTEARQMLNSTEDDGESFDVARGTVKTNVNELRLNYIPIMFVPTIRRKHPQFACPIAEPSAP